MKKTDKFEITIDFHKKICVTKKMVVVFLLFIVLLTLAVSNCSPEALADVVRLIISTVSKG